MNSTPTGRDGEPLRRRIPLWLKIAYTLFVCVLVPVYTVEHGVLNFMWFSNIALLATVAALWIEHRLLAGMMALAVTLPEIGWNIDYFGRLLTGSRLIGLTDYMWDWSIPLFVRGLSLYHVALPVLLVWMVGRMGYDRRAMIAQSMAAWVVLPLTHALTGPDKNVNWVFGPGGSAQDRIPELAWLAILMVGFPVLIYLPTHLVFRRLFDEERGTRW